MIFTFLNGVPVGIIQFVGSRCRLLIEFLLGCVLVTYRLTLG